MAKQKWTVERGPRVYEIAHFLDLLSKDVLTDLRRWFDLDCRSSSSRVPLPTALDYCQWTTGNIRWYRC